MAKPLDGIKVIGPGPGQSALAGSDGVEQLGDALDVAAGVVEEVMVPTAQDLKKALEPSVGMPLPGKWIADSELEGVVKAAVEKNVGAFLKKFIADQEHAILSGSTPAPGDGAVGLFSCSNMEQVEIQTKVAADWAEGSLEELVYSMPAFGQGLRSEQILGILRRRVTAAEGRGGGPALCKAITRQLDHAAGEAEMRHGGGEASRVALQEARGRLAAVLAERCAEHLALAADAVKGYGVICGEYATVKADVDARVSRKERIPVGENQVAAKRREREKARELVQHHLNNAWLVASGGAVE